jgi:hypothetical protein
LVGDVVEVDDSEVKVDGCDVIDWAGAWVVYSEDGGLGFDVDIDFSIVDRESGEGGLPEEVLRDLLRGV